MKTLAIMSQKGGSGKTTLAVHLAAYAIGQKVKAALIDLDPRRARTNGMNTVRNTTQ
jgi:chromosome partitioning protein